MSNRVRYYRIIASLVCITVLSACGSTPPAPELPKIPPVGDVTLLQGEQATQAYQQLDLGIVVFNVETPAAQSTVPGSSLYQEIAEKEAHYLPYVLRNILVASDQWGVVRVLPEADPSVDLTLQGTLLESSGLNLQLHLLATDSTGREWINKTYRDETSFADYPGPDPFLRGVSRDEELLAELAEAEDPFVDIYRQIANDLLLFRNTFTQQQIDNISLVSQMRYAADLSPQTFDRTLEQGPDGLWRVVTLLAEDDPMLRRVEDIKLRHHLFIDTIDEYYESLYQEMQPSYALWRRYSRDQALEDRSEVRREFRNDVGSSSFTALSQSYNRYMWAKLFEQEFTALAAGFNNEVAPAILELNRLVHGLTGSVDEQYTQWRDILRQIFELETGL